MGWFGVKELLEVHPQLAKEIEAVWLKHRYYYERDKSKPEQGTIDYVLGKLAGVYAVAFREFLDQNRRRFKITDMTSTHIVRRGMVLEFKIDNTRLSWDDDEWAEVPGGINVWNPNEEAVEELRREFIKFIRAQDLARMRARAVRVADGFGGEVVSYFYHPSWEVAQATA